MEANRFQFVKMNVPLRPFIQNELSLENKVQSPYWTATCPFHKKEEVDVDGDFTVSETKDVWYCFGCHIGGDVISWVARLYNLSTNDACDKIIKECGLEIPKEVLEKEEANKLGV